MVEDRWPSSTPNWNSVVMVNRPLHTNDAIKLGLRGFLINLHNEACFGYSYGCSELGPHTGRAMLEGSGSD